MTPEALKALSEHWTLIAGLVALSAAAGGLVVFAFRLFFGWERRVKTIAKEVVELVMGSPVFGQAVQRISESFTAEVKLQIADLKERDNERADAVGRAHRRIDDLAKETSAQLLDLAKRLPASGGRG